MFFQRKLKDLEHNLRAWVGAYVETQIEKHERENKHTPRLLYSWQSNGLTITTESLKSDLDKANARIDLLLKHFDLSPVTVPAQPAVTYLVSPNE